MRLKLHTNLQSAHIEDMSGLFFYVLIILLTILFLPIFLNFDWYYDVFTGKIVILFSLMNIFKILGGYVTSYDKGFALHKSDKTAVLLPYTEIDNERKRFSFIKTFKFQSISVDVQCSANTFYLFNFIQKGLEVLKFSNDKLNNMHLTLKLFNKDTLKITGRCVFRLNLFILLIDFIEYLWRKMKNLWQEKTKKSTT